MNDDSINKNEILRFIFEFLIVFILIVGVPFMLSGVWPPFVNIISESMEPNMNSGDMVFIVENERYVDGSVHAGINTGESEAKKKFNKYGDVIVYYPDGKNESIPIIHRAELYVEKGEDWTKKADREHLTYNDCSMLKYCPAPHSGFITLGDNNQYYDQVGNISSPVKEEWVVGRAMYRIPYAGDINIFT